MGEGRRENDRIEEAKMTGMTPPASTLSGRWVAWPPRPAAHHALGVLHRDAPLAPLDQHDEGDHRHHQRGQDDELITVHAPLPS